MNGDVRPLDLKLPDFHDNKSQGFTRMSSGGCRERNPWPTGQLSRQRPPPPTRTSSSQELEKSYHSYATPTTPATTPTKEITMALNHAEEAPHSGLLRNKAKTWQNPCATGQQEFSERRKRVWSWREQQAQRLQRQKEARRSSNLSTVSFHSSKTISEVEMSCLFSLNHPNPNRGLGSESRVKANQLFTSGYDCFMSFKPRPSRKTAIQEHSVRHQSTHNTRLLEDSEVNALVSIQPAQKQHGTQQGSVSRLARCHSPKLQAPPASRVSSAMPTSKRRPSLVHSVATSVVIHFPSPGSTNT